MTSITTRFGASALAAALVLGSAACTDLDLEPLDTATPNILFRDEASYTSAIAKVYAGLAVTGQTGPAGSSDITGLDEGFGNYVRALWKLQELPTDECVIAWQDPGLPELVQTTWSPNNGFINAMYARIYFQVSLANEFIRESAPELLDERGIREAFRPTIEDYQAEARFLRALSYYHALDLFGRGPLYDETQTVGSAVPQQGDASQLFDFVETELAAIAELLPAPGAAEYGRVDQAAVWSLQSMLFLNAQVYVGQERYSDAAAAAQKVIDSGAYSLDEDYQALFRADNDQATGIVFAVPFDGDNTQSFGGTTFLVHAPLGGEVDALAFGVNSGWGGLRATPEFVSFFDDITGESDERAIFFTEGQTLDIVDLDQFSQGYIVPKWTNLRADGSVGSDLVHPDTDFPLFRLADAHLNYAEAVLRGGSGDRGRALELVNDLRRRAYDSDNFAITDGDFDLEVLLGERTRETYWEGKRRTDLRRYGRYTGGDYVWTFKGNAVEGAALPDFRALYPIPASELISNPNLTQNPGY